MGAPLGFKTFTTGDVLTAADTNGYLMQGVWTFASAAARDAAVTSPQEGNVCYLKDTDAVMTYSGSAWVAIGGASGPAFRAYRNTSAQTFTAATYTKVQWNAESFDTDNCFDSTTNYRFTPTKAGYYLFSTTVTGQTGGFFISAFYKNGTINAAMRNIPFSGAFAASTNSTLINCNGTTDYVEVYAYGSSGSPQVDNGTDLSYFTGVWVRS